MVPASDLLVYVVKIGNPLYARYTEPFIRNYCREHGYHLVFASMRCDSLRHPSWEKLMALRHVESPFVLLMDLDIVPMPRSLPIHTVLNPNCLNLVQVIPGRGSQRRLRRWNYPVEAMRWNAGLIGVPRCEFAKLDELYWNADLAQEVWMEQGALNLAIFNDRFKVHELHPHWNYWVKDEWQSSELDSRFLHLAGNKKRRLRNAIAISNFYSELDSRYFPIPAVPLISP